MSEKINPQSLKPAHLMRLLNTAGLGTVLSEHRLRRHRNRAGYAIGTEKSINLFKYAAWLTHEFFREKQVPKDYTEKKRIRDQKHRSGSRRPGYRRTTGGRRSETESRLDPVVQGVL